MRGGSTGVKDVAARAGVSVGTVSNVLNRPDMVSEATRRKVLQAITELGFVRNESGRHLRAGRSRTIAYLVLDASNPFFTDVAKGIEETARTNGIALYMCNSDGEAAARPTTSSCSSSNGCAASSSPPSTRTPRSWTSSFARASLSCSWTGRPARLVQCRGRRRRGRRARGDPPVRTGPPAHRLRGRTDEHRAGGRPPARDPQGPSGHGPVGGVPHRPGDGRAQRRGGPPGRRAARRAPSITATDCGLLRQRPRRPRPPPADDARWGSTSPGDLAIVGYDDIEFAGAAAVALSSVRQPRQLLGRVAAELLLAESEAGAEHVHQQVVFRPELVVRTSSLGARPARSATATTRRR